MQVLAFISID